MQDLLFVKRRRKNSIVSSPQHVTSPRISVVRTLMFTIEGKMNLDMNDEKSCDTSPRLVLSISSSCINNMKISIRLITEGRFYKSNTKNLTTLLLSLIQCVRMDFTTLLLNLIQCVWMDLRILNSEQKFVYVILVFIIPRMNQAVWKPGIRYLVLCRIMEDYLALSKINKYKQGHFVSFDRYHLFVWNY